MKAPCYQHDSYHAECSSCVEMNKCIDPIEQEIKELLAAGWEKMMSTVWKSPSGALFRGPHGAWQRMKMQPQLNVKAPVANAVAGDQSLCGPNHRQRGVR